MLESVLIANRGEIAVRIARTCRELGVRSIAVHTDVDAGAPHVDACDDAVRVESYLDADAVLAAAREQRAAAIHPGYGFLSERAPFARAAEEAGIVFVGPSADVIDLMGRKDAAREVAVAAGVPVVPAYSLDDDPASLTYPVLAKAAAGGGGKGMRIVRSAAELPEALAAAGREARAAFGDDAMLLERFVERGRHIEVQVMADAHGHVVHLGTRDCSAQRRHQKVLEEAPAPDLDPATRERLHRAAVDLATQVGYRNAGTVEFLLDVASGDFFFLEMNTRLQVEHPVTEAVTGLDLVALQLRVAAGEPLGLTQDDVACEGHAVEARVYAEDAFGGFLPQAGTATRVVWPEHGARVDHALRDGQVVSTSYDPMLGKIVVHAADRERAREALVEALDGTAILGLTTNTGFLRLLADSEEFRAGPVDTAWLDRHPLPAPDDAGARACAGLVLGAELAAAPPGPWQPDGFRPGGASGPVFEHGIDLSHTGWSTVPRERDGLWSVGTLAHGDALVRRGRHETEVVLRGQRFVFAADDAAGAVVAAGDGTLAAPMPGTVLDVRVVEGESVTEGQVLGTMEAMKMELALTAPFAGTVARVGAAAGDQVALGAVLFEVEPA